MGLRDCVQNDRPSDECAATGQHHYPKAGGTEQPAMTSEKYGLINDRANRLAYADDSSYYLLCALEVIDEDGKLERKADMFTKRTIKPHQAVAVVDAASEALAVSIWKSLVNSSYMSQLTGKTKEELAELAEGVIFHVYRDSWRKDGTPHYVTADEYLSGNVRRKLRQAQRAAPGRTRLSDECGSFRRQPRRPGCASEMEVRLGAAW